MITATATIAPSSTTAGTATIESLGREIPLAPARRLSFCPFRP